jgi:iron-sulfur cluster assembly accessory protein
MPPPPPRHKHRAAGWRRFPCAAAAIRGEGWFRARRSPIFSRMSEAAISLSPSAAARVAAIAVRQGKPPMLRLSVEGGGCAGFQYRFGLADAADDGDVAVVRDGVTLVVDPMSLDLVRGSVVDFVESLGGAAFQVTNPNAASGCGCGTSFSI